MPQFRYTGDDARVFPHLSLDVEPGDVITADDNPDLRYFVSDNALANAPALESAPIPDPAPLED